MTGRSRRAWRRGRRSAWALASGAGLAYYLPSVLILPTFWKDPPHTLPGGVCRWRATTGRPRVALTFDDGPSVDTPRTLDELDELGLRATFFVLGEQLRAHPELAQEIVRRGHQVASHGYAHRHHLLSSPERIKQDFAAARRAHDEILGRTPRYYRPTYGQLCAATLVEARRHQMELVLWSRWGKEFDETDVAPVMRRLEPGLGAGAILLLHDNDVSCRVGTGDLTRRVLRPLSRALADRGLTSVTLDQLLRSTDLPTKPFPDLRIASAPR